MENYKLFIIALIISACNPGPSSDSESQAKGSYNADSQKADNTHFPGCQNRFRNYWDRCLYQIQKNEVIRAAGYQGVNPALDNPSSARESQGSCVALEPTIASKLLNASPESTDSSGRRTRAIVPMNDIDSFANKNIGLMEAIFNHWRTKHPNDAQAAGNQGISKCEQFLDSKNGSIRYIWELGDKAGCSQNPGSECNDKTGP